MKHKIFLFAMLFLAIFNINLLYSIELDTVWRTNKFGGLDYFFQHPVTNNIILNGENGGKIAEIDSKTGEFIRNLGVASSGVDLSPDGSMIVSSGIDYLEIHNYENLELIKRIEGGHSAKFLDNNRIIFLNNSQVRIYNLTSKETKIIQTTRITAFSVSTDGKYVAFGVREKVDGLPGDVAKLVLCDGDTLGVIKELDKWENTGHEIIQINFSFDSKYLTFQGSFSTKIPTSIFEVASQKRIIEFKPTIIGDISYIHFLDNKYLLRIHFNNENNKRFCTILDYTNFQVIDTLNINFRKMIIYNQIENCIYGTIKNYNEIQSEYYTAKYQLKDILSNNIKTEIKDVFIYQNNLLTIYQSNLQSIELTDLNGRIILNKTFDYITNQIEIPIELTNGLYFININSGHKITTHKLLVKE